MSIVQSISVSVAKPNNTTATIPEGFLSASFVNIGAADATLTQDGKTWTLKSGNVFNLPIPEGNQTWKAVTIDATGTTVECVYF